MITYAYAPADQISYEVRKAAEMALAAARKELKLPVVSIKWFFKTEKMRNPYNPHADGNLDVFGQGTFTHESDILGLFRRAEPDVIFIMGGQSVAATKNTVYHETFHLWQFKQGFGFGNHTEELAQGYAEDAMKRMRLYGEDEQTYLEHMVGKDWSEKVEKKPVKNASDSTRNNTKRDSETTWEGNIKYSFGRISR